MHTIYRALLVTHIAIGFAGLVAFWFPVFARKGGTLHVRVGKVFLWAAYVVAGSAFALGLMDIFIPFQAHPEARPSDPAAAPGAMAEIRSIGVFLAYLAIVTLTSVHHGVRAIQNKTHPENIRTPFHTSLNAAAIGAALGVLVLGIVVREPIFLLLSPIGLIAGPANLRYVRRAPRERMGHWYEHMGSMIGAGIAFHTAFAVFGGARLLGLDGLEGTWAFLPWVLPTLIGTVAVALTGRHYRRKFGKAQRGELAGVTPTR